MNPPDIFPNAENVPTAAKTRKSRRTFPVSMMPPGFLAGAFCFISSAWSAAALPAPATGANVDESRVAQTFRVDASSAEAADDDKHGTPDVPFATLHYACLAAARAKDAGTGVKLVLASGTYRETAEIPAPANGKPDNDAPLVIEAAERDQAVIDGADTEGWSPSTWKAENGRWTHPWPFTRAKVTVHKPGFEPPANTALQHGDMVYVNGAALRQVNTEAELAPGCFWVNVTHPAKGQAASGSGVVVEPPADTVLDGAIVQVGARPGGLRISQRRNVVVRGVLCEHVANPAGTGAEDDTAGLVLAGCTDVLLEDVLCQWNDGTGLRTRECKETTLRRVRLLYNGNRGLMVESGENLLSEDCEASFNGFRGEWAGGVFSGNSVVIMALNVRGTTWRRLHVLSNAGWGMYTNGAQDVTVEDAVLQGNMSTGLSMHNCGPLCVRRCVVVGTKSRKDNVLPPPDVPDENASAGVSLASCMDVTLESNVFADNAARQLLVINAAGAGQIRSARHTYRHNVFSGTDASQGLCALVEAGPNGLEAVYHHMLNSDENDYWNPQLAEGFTVFDQPPSSKVGHGRQVPPRPITFDKWREFLAARLADVPVPPETHSFWKDPLFVDPKEGDFRLKENSPAADWGLPSDEGAAAP